MSFSRRVTCLFLLLSFVVGSRLFAADPKAEFAKLRRDVQQQLKSPQPAERVAALQKLATVPVADSVRLIQKSLEDPENEVRLSAYETLLNLNDNLEVCKTLLLSVRKSMQQGDENGEAAPLLAVLVTSTLPEIERETTTLLSKSSGKHAEHIVLALADGLGASGLEINVRPLAALADTKAFRESYAVRRAVVDALIQIHKPAAIGGLIGLLDKVQGEAQADALEHLSHVTDQIYGFETAAWHRWWEAAESTYAYPERKRQTPYRDGTLAAPGGDYYGMPIFAQRMVFIIDTSGSMAGHKLEMAKRELTRAIDRLQPDAFFSVVIYNTYVDVWQPKLVKASPQYKKAAITYVQNQPARANTASYDALDAAFVFDTEAIYFLSDGAPNGGKIEAPVDIIAAVTTANMTRRISLYTIGVAAGFPGSVLDQFLATLAKQNFGVYRRVDE